MSTVTYKGQPPIERTKGKVPLAGTSHLYRVKRILWSQSVESVLQGLLIPTSLHVRSGHSLPGDIRVDSDRAVSPDSRRRCRKTSVWRSILQLGVMRAAV